jgi:hypothetical protein
MFNGSGGSVGVEGFLCERDIITIPGGLLELRF